MGWYEEAKELGREGNGSVCPSNSDVWDLCLLLCCCCRVAGAGTGAGIGATAGRGTGSAGFDGRRLLLRAKLCHSDSDDDNDDDALLLWR